MLTYIIKLRNMTYVSDQAYSGDERDKRYQFHSLHEPSEQQKQTSKYLYFWANYFIAMTRERSKLALEKAYAQKKGKYDPFRPLRLNRNYGIKRPRDIAHIPVVEPFFRRLKGTHKSTPIRFQTTTNNTSSYLLKQQEKTSEVMKSLAMLEEQMLKMRMQGLSTSAVEKFIDQKHDQLRFRIENEFRSSLEVQGQHALNYLVERCSVKDVLDDLFDDLAVCRMPVWQVKVERLGEMPKPRSLDPRKIFFSKRPETKWIRECDSYVYKERMLVSEVLAQYGEYFDEEQIKIIQDEKSIYWQYNQTFYNQENWDNVKNTDPDFEINGLKGEYIDVYYVEWKALNKKKEVDEVDGMDEKKLGDSIVSGPDKIYNKGYRQDLYCCTRIGSCIYLKSGKVEHVVRDQDDPDKCYLSADGMIQDGRFGEIDSLYQRVQSLADDYDVYANKLRQHISKSGPKVLTMIRENIPAEYGRNPIERVLKAYERLQEGHHEISISQSGANLAAQQYANSSIDMSMSKDVASLPQILAFIEELIGRIFGTPRQALGDIGQTDGKGTTQMALMQYLMMSQDIFMDMHNITQRVLTQLLNAFRVCFPKGFAASYSEAGKQVHFEIKDNFSLASFNVFLSNTGEEQALLELYRQIAGDMAAQGRLENEDLVAILAAKSLAEIQRELYKKLEASKENMVSELQQQMAQMEQELKDMKRQVDVNQQAENENNAMKLQLEQEKLKIESQLKAQAQADEKAFQDKKIELDNKRVNLEGAQVLMDEGSSTEVRNY
jgi:hypothetical protein